MDLTENVSCVRLGKKFIIRGAGKYEIYLNLFIDCIVFINERSRNILTKHHNPLGAVAAYRLANPSWIPKFGRYIALLHCFKTPETYPKFYLQVLGFIFPKIKSPIFYDT
jgi:hypothetical protein